MPKWKQGDKCKRCQSTLTLRKGKKKPEKTFYYAWFLWCSKCKATYFDPDNRIFNSESEDRIVKADTGIHRELRKTFMDFVRGLKSEQKQEVKRELPVFMESFE